MFKARFLAALTAVLLLPAKPALCAARGTPDVTLTFVGDIMLDGGPGHLVSNDGDPFAHVTEILLESDMTVGNLECAITRKGHAEDKTYTFKGPLESLGLLRKYFTVLSLANNHSGDWGTAGFADELTLLSEERIAWVGGGRNEREARRPFVADVKGQRIAILAYNDYPPKSFAATTTKPGTAWLVEKSILDDIRAARVNSKANWVFLFLHWGEELEPRPTAEQVALAHRLLDAGADGIVGTHPHVTQTIEWYGNKPIVYSLGNFVFDYFPGDPAIWYSYILQLTLAPERKPTLNTIPLELDAAGIPHLTTEAARSW